MPFCFAPFSHFLNYPHHSSGLLALFQQRSFPTKYENHHDRFAYWIQHSTRARHLQSGIHLVKRSLQMHRYIIICTTHQVPNKKIAAIYRLVRDYRIRAHHIGTDIMPGIEGGEIHEHTEFMGEVHERSIDRMTAEAKRMRANSLVETCLTASMVVAEAAELAA